MLGFSRAALAALLTTAACCGPAIAASTCATDTDMAAFRTAAVQQQLMVAALTCKQVEAYNRFVLAYQPELQKSDADLKAYFARRGNVAEYDTFKTKLANLSSLSDIANGQAYCDNARAAFDMAIRSRQALSSFVADQRLMIAMPKQTVCSEAKPQEPVLQEAGLQQPPIAAPTKRVAVESLPAPGLAKVATAMPTPRPAPPEAAKSVEAKVAEAKPVRVAMAQPAPKITHEPPPLVVNLVMAEPKLPEEAPAEPAPRTYVYHDTADAAEEDSRQATDAHDRQDEGVADEAPRRVERPVARHTARNDDDYDDAPPPRHAQPRVQPDDADEDYAEAPRHAPPQRTYRAQREDADEDDDYADVPPPPRLQRPQIARDGYYARYAYYQSQYGRRPRPQDEDDDYYYRGR